MVALLTFLALAVYAAGFYLFVETAQRPRGVRNWIWWMLSPVLVPLIVLFVAIDQCRSPNKG